MAVTVKNLGRSLRFLWQRWTRGFDDRATWNLDAELARWFLPRFRRFREITRGNFLPGIEGFEDRPEKERIAEWERIQDEIEWFLDLHAHDTWALIVPGDPAKTEANRVRYREAGRLLGAYFGALWW